MPKRLEDEKSNEETKKSSEEDPFSKLVMLGAPSEPELRTMTIIGDINEDITKDILSALWYLNNNAKIEELVNPEDPDCVETKEVIQPIEIVI